MDKMIHTTFLFFVLHMNHPVFRMHLEVLQKLHQLLCNKVKPFFQIREAWLDLVAQEMVELYEEFQYALEKRDGSGIPNPLY